MKTYGTLIRIANHHGCPSMAAICTSILERDQALAVARFEMDKEYWVGTKQAIFMGTDGVLELFDLRVTAVEKVMDARDCQL